MRNNCNCGGWCCYGNSRRRYGFFNFVGDLIMLCLTWGLWAIWIFCREMRNR